MPRARVLVVDDKANMLKLCREILAGAFDIETAPNGEAALALLETASFEVVLTDVRMPALDGRTLLATIHRRELDVEVVLMTGYGTIEGAVEALRSGAFDYISKPFDPEALLAAVKAAAGHRKARREAATVRRRIESRFGMDAIVGTSAVMRSVFDAIEAARRSVGPILLLGEPGTGKELVARVIHHGEHGSGYPFLVVDPRAVRPNRLREVLFGESHEANEGTLFVAEIAAVPTDQQGELARALDAGLEHRIAAASRLDLRAEVQAGRFRGDLLARLERLTIALPPLRDRSDDIALLAGHFIAKHAPRIAPSVERIAPEALAALAAYSWPDNVRGLEHVIERALVASTGDTVQRQAIAPEILAVMGATPREPVDPTSLSFREALTLARERMSQQYIAALLRTCDGNVTRAADLAGLERESLHRLMRRYGIRSEDFKSPLRRENDDEA